MAAKQAAAIGRIGRLRSGVIAVMRATKPRAFAAIEQSSSRRVSDADDAFIIACVEHLMRNGVGESSGVPFSEIRGHLERLGVVLAGDDPTVWVQQLRSMTPPEAAAGINVTKATATSFADAARLRGVAQNSWEGVLSNGPGIASTPAVTMPSPITMTERTDPKPKSAPVVAAAADEPSPGPAQEAGGLEDIFAPESVQPVGAVDDIFSSSFLPHPTVDFFRDRILLFDPSRHQARHFIKIRMPFMNLGKVSFFSRL
jgi:hypothetical protein